jgi:RHS repeat-associated protein
MAAVDRAGCPIQSREFVYGPLRDKFAQMSGTTLQKAFVPLPAGTAVYTGSGLAYYRHGDHLSSSRLATTPARTMYSSTAYAPFGEPYAQAGTTDLSFAGHDQDTVSGIHDALFRKYVPVQGRWLSPDPAGTAAADPTNPQSWNRYAYVLNNPLANVDPLGLACDLYGSDVDGDVTSSCDSSFEMFVSVTDYVFDANIDGKYEASTQNPNCPSIYVCIDVPNGPQGSFGVSGGGGGGGAPSKSNCPSLPSHPEWGDNFQKDIDMLNSQNPVFRLITFKQEVQTGGPWDYKDQVPGMQQAWADFGNFHYGFVGAGAGIPNSLLLWGAGLANWHDNPQNRPLYGSPFDPRNPTHGDQPDDQAQIKAGIAAYRAGCRY